MASPRPVTLPAFRQAARVHRVNLSAFARAARVSRGHLYAVLRGDRRPGVALATRLAQFVDAARDA